MHYQNESFGMMDSGYFVPRSEILGWINCLLHLNITKIETLGAGNIYCQILDVIYPGKVALSKVNWKAKLDYEFINNLKILQSSFDKLGIKKHIEVEKLSKAKYQDNLQLIQWFKRYYDINCGGRGDNYPADEKRGFVDPDFSFSEKEPPGKHGHQSKMVSVVSQPSIRPKKMTSPNLGMSGMVEKTPSNTTRQTGKEPKSKSTKVIHESEKEEEELLTTKDTPTKSEKSKSVKRDNEKSISEVKEKQKQQPYVKSPHEEKLELIGEILAKKDLSSDEKLALIEEVMSL